MSEQRSTNNGLQTSGRLGRTYRFEYVNRAGEPVNPKNGKPYARPNKSKESGGKRKRNLPSKRAGVMFGGLEVIPTDPSIDPPPRACFNCWQQGHSRRNCPRPRVARICNNCGRRGEDLSTCPRCSQAHTRYLEKLRIKGLKAPNFDGLDFEEQLLGQGPEQSDDACDEVLRELIYQDDRARELMYQQQQIKHEHVNDHQLDSYRNVQPRFSEQSDDYQDVKPHFVEQQIDELYAPREKKYFDSRWDEQKEPKLPYPDHYESESSRRRSTSPSRLSSYRRTEDWATGSDTSDPVHDIMQLAKTIAHLTPETQDLIMRQVIAERKEKARLRELKGQVQDEWP